MQKRRGRPPGKKNVNVSDLSEGLLDDVEAAPAPQRQVRADNREPAHEPRAGARGGAVARGRDGRILTRTRRSTGDRFQVDPSIIPDGWDYQWNTISVLGSTQEARSVSLQMQANGWTPVPADRHDGQWTPVGYKGEIIVDGNRLEERPKILSQEARREDIQKAKQLIQERNEALKLAGAKDLPSGMVPTRRNNVRMSMDASLDADIPRPSYETPEPGE